MNKDDYLQCELLWPVSACLSVCLSTRISQEPHAQISPNCLYSLPSAVARSSSDGSAMRYVLPALWMTSCFRIMQAIGHSQKLRVYFVQFAGWQHQSDSRQHCLVEIARWRHRGRSLLSPAASCWCSLMYCLFFLKAALYPTSLVWHSLNLPREMVLDPVKRLLFCFNDKVLPTINEGQRDHCCWGRWN